MPPNPSNWNRSVALQEMLGYLNFSTGKPDARFQQNLNEWYGYSQETEPWKALELAMRTALGELRGVAAAFRDTQQADSVIDILFHQLLPRYRAYHSDLLFHLSDFDLFQPFFLARAFEAVLAEGGPWDEQDRIVRNAIERLNDFVGHRPVAVLERQKCEPYDHERLRPIPLYIRGAGVACGKYHDIVAAALEILGQTNPSILADAQFSLKMLDELAMDPRAYDYGHPVQQRPNYQFGEWDPHCIDNAGNYRRLVVRQVTLDALVERVRQERVQGSGFGVQQSDRPASEPQQRVQGSGFRVQSSDGPASEPRTLNPEPSLYESAAVLAGTMLMASGMSGYGPDAYDSSVTLATLVPRIARYRDQFYEQLLPTAPAELVDHLRHEAATLRQPFGGVRQHLNRYIAHQRAAQVQNVRLAALFGSMGYPQASAEYAHKIPAASARIQCEISRRITAGHAHIDRAELADSLRLVLEVEDWLRRGIACGAIVDPWNILGFQGQFSIFAARENSVPDPRVEQLTAVMEALFLFYARLLAEAASRADREIEAPAAASMRRLAEWWDRFATIEVSGVRRVHGGEAVEAATHVAHALGLWHKGGQATGNIKFWRQHTKGFHSPRAYDQVVQALMRKHDHVAAMALLVSWLSRADDVPLEQGPHSFYQLASDWLQAVTHTLRDPNERWTTIQKFFDYLEANAEEYWQVPRLSLDPPGRSDREDRNREDRRSGDEEERGEEEKYSAAYESVSYRDSAEDGHEGELLDGAPSFGEFPLEAAAERIEPRLKFLTMLATLWQLAADLPATSSDPDMQSDPVPTVATPPTRHPEQALGTVEGTSVQHSWLRQLRRNHHDLEKLLDELQQCDIPQPLGSHDSLVEYDRRRSIKEQLVYQVIDTLVEGNKATRRLLRSLAVMPTDIVLTAWERHAVDIERALERDDLQLVRSCLPRLFGELAAVPVLYRRWDRGGHPREIVAARTVQHSLHLLVEALPRSGLIRETYHVLRTARGMEQTHPVGEGVTEFDHLFRAAFRAVVENVLNISTDWPAHEQADQPLLECVEELAEPFLKLWLEHSQTLRLSTLDRMQNESEWQRLRQFIETYGHDLLTPMFLTLGNLRAISDQGALRFIEYLEQDPDPINRLRLVKDLGVRISRQDAIKLLELIVHIFLENYEEYRDYNCTTTQSDYGERFFVLLQFLHFKARYERTNWNLQPVAMVHGVLARKRRMDAAHLWQEAMDEKTSETADMLLHALAALEQETGVRLATVRDRLSERFTRSLTVDRARALVEPAMHEATQDSNALRSGAFQQLCEELHDFIETPSGIGLEVPRWLRTLESEVSRVCATKDAVSAVESSPPLPRKTAVSRADLSRQLEIWDEPL